MSEWHAAVSVTNLWPLYAIEKHVLNGHGNGWCPVQVAKSKGFKPACAENITNCTQSTPAFRCVLRVLTWPVKRVDAGSDRIVPPRDEPKKDSAHEGKDGRGSMKHGEI